METNPIASTRPLLIKLLLDFMFYALLFNSTKSSADLLPYLNRPSR